MRRLAIAAACAILLVGCGPMRSASHSPFFMSHDTAAYFNAAAKAKGYTVGGGGSGRSMRSTGGMKDFHVSIKGDAALRDKLMRDYKDAVEAELNKAGVSINGRGTGGNIWEFSFEYETRTAVGFVRANAVVDANGYVEIDVLMYEHN